MRFSSTENGISRRSLLKTGFFGSITLATGSLGAMLTGCATQPAGNVVTDSEPPHRYHFLSKDDLVLLAAIAPVIVSSDKGSQPEMAQDQLTHEQTQKLLADIDTAIYHFSGTNKKEVRQLFDLLNFAPTRGLLGGVWSSWQNATKDDINDFLEDWRYSSLGLLNKAYAALVKIVATSWYIQQENWALSGYSGPPDFAIQSLPQFNV